MATAQLGTSSKTIKQAVVERWFFTSMALAMIAITVAGFGPSIVNPAGRRGPISLLAAVHGTVFSVWLLLFLAQTLLIATDRVNWHKRLGMASTFVLALMLPLGYEATIAMTRRGFDLSGDQHVDLHPQVGQSLTLDALTASVFNFCYLSAFAALTIAAICYRQRPAIHKRLMLFANIELIGAPMAHLLGHANLLTPATVMIPLVMFLFAALVRDYLVERRIHPLTAVLAIALFIAQPVEGVLIGPSPLWHHFVTWLIE
jgi:hypothetical protein